MKPHLLFLAHDFSSTGAPKVLLNFLQWLRRKNEVSIEILGKREGALSSAFNELAPITYAPHPASNPELIARLEKSPPALIVSNTMTNGEMLRDLAFLRCPKVTVSQELAYWVEKSGKQNLEFVKKYSSHFVAYTESGKKFLTGVVGIASDRVSVVPVAVDLPSVDDLAGARAAARRRLGIADDAFVVGGSGMEMWRKGKDLFADVALRIAEQIPHARFVWIGGNRFDPTFLKTYWRTRLSAAGRNIRWVRQVPDPMNYYPAFDLFLMTSREDLFPLVVLENAALGVPSLCFESCGSRTFIREDAGRVIPDFDITQMAGAAIALAADPRTRTRLGRTAGERARTDHGLENSAEYLWRCLRTIQGWDGADLARSTASR